MNLFASMILQCLVRLVIYVDQMIVRQQSSSKSEDLADQSQNSTQSSDEVWGIDNTVSVEKINISFDFKLNGIFHFQGILKCFEHYQHY